MGHAKYIKVDIKRYGIPIVIPGCLVRMFHIYALRAIVA